MLFATLIVYDNSPLAAQAFNAVASVAAQCTYYTVTTTAEVIRNVYDPVQVEANRIVWLDPSHAYMRVLTRSANRLVQVVRLGDHPLAGQDVALLEAFAAAATRKAAR